MLDHFDRIDTVMKWYTLSGVEGRTPFKFGQEPLQTIRTLVTTRNRIAHPKVENFGNEIMVRKPSGELMRNVPLDHMVEGGDEIIDGVGEHLKTFNYDETRRRIKKGVVAIDMLRRHLAIAHLNWTVETLSKL